jgi:sec-independent protein translocase protein TatC
MSDHEPAYAALPDADLPTSESLAQTPLIEHLSELRSRLIKCFVILIVMFGVCFYFIEHIFAFLIAPLYKALGHDAVVSYFAPQEAFFSYMNLALYSAVLLSLPFFLVQAWAFVAPGLYKHERNAFFPFIIATPVMFFAGAALAYYVMMPAALKFFAAFQFHNATVSVVQQTRVTDYLSFVKTFLLAFGLSFQIPVLLVLLGRAGIVKAQMLRQTRRYAILGMAGISAVVTPPDLLSMAGLLVPLIMLYEGAILLVAHFEKQAAKRAAASRG